MIGALNAPSHLPRNKRTLAALVGLGDTGNERMKKLFIPLAVLGLGLIFAAPSYAADLSYERSTQLRRSGVIAPAGEDVLVQRRAMRPGYRYGYGTPDRGS